MNHWSAYSIRRMIVAPAGKGLGLKYRLNFIAPPFPFGFASKG